jgi:hypothetical protein
MEQHPYADVALSSFQSFLDEKGGYFAHGDQVYERALQTLGMLGVPQTEQFVGKLVERLNGGEKQRELDFLGDVGTLYHYTPSNGASGDAWATTQARVIDNLSNFSKMPFAAAEVASDSLPMQIWGRNKLRRQIKRMAHAAYSSIDDTSRQLQAWQSGIPSGHVDQVLPREAYAQIIDKGSNFATDVAGAVPSLAPAILAAPLGLPAMAAVAGAQGAGINFADNRHKEGAERYRSAISAGLIDGLTTYVGGKYGVEALAGLDDAAKLATKNDVAKFLITNGLGDYAEEGSAGFLQAINDGKTFQEAAEAMFYEGAIGGVLGTAVSGGARAPEIAQVAGQDLAQAAGAGIQVAAKGALKAGEVIAPHAKTLAEEVAAIGGIVRDGATGIASDVAGVARAAAQPVAEQANKVILTAQLLRQPRNPQNPSAPANTELEHPYAELAKHEQKMIAAQQEADALADQTQKAEQMAKGAATTGVDTEGVFGPQFTGDMPWEINEVPQSNEPKWKPTPAPAGRPGRIELVQGDAAPDAPPQPVGIVDQKPEEVSDKTENTAPVGTVESIFTPGGTDFKQVKAGEKVVVTKGKHKGSVYTIEEVRDDGRLVARTADGKLRGGKAGLTPANFAPAPAEETTEQAHPAPVSGPVPTATIEERPVKTNENPLPTEQQSVGSGSIGNFDTLRKAIEKRATEDFRRDGKAPETEEEQKAWSDRAKFLATNILMPTGMVGQRGAHAQLEQAYKNAYSRANADAAAQPEQANNGQVTEDHEKDEQPAPNPQPGDQDLGHPDMLIMRSHMAKRANRLISTLETPEDKKHFIENANIFADMTAERWLRGTPWERSGTAKILLKIEFMQTVDEWKDSRSNNGQATVKQPAPSPQPAEYAEPATTTAVADPEPQPVKDSAADTQEDLVNVNTEFAAPQRNSGRSREEPDANETSEGNPTIPFNDKKNLMKASRTWARENLVGRSIEREEVGKIQFTVAGIKHATSGRHSVMDLSALPQIADIIKTGTYKGFDPDRKNREHVRGVHRFEKSVTVNGIEGLGVAMVRETASGNFFYDGDFFYDSKRANPPAQPGHHDSATSETEGDTGFNTNGSGGEPNKGFGSPQRDIDPGSPDRDLDKQDNDDGRGEIGRTEAGRPFERTKRKNTPDRPKIDAIPTKAKRLEHYADRIKKFAKDLTDAGLGQTKVEGRIVVPRGLGGYFNEATGATGIAHEGDLDSTAHEISHRIAALNDLVDLPSLPATDLAWWGQFGSKPPAGLRKEDRERYLRHEGWAEFMRAWAVAPSSTSKFPELERLMREHVPQEQLEALESFGNYVRQIEGMPAADRPLHQIEALEELIKRQTSPIRKAIGWLNDLAHGRNVFSTKDKRSLGEFTAGSWRDWLAFRWFNDAHLAIKGWHEGLARQGREIDELSPFEDYRLLNRLSRGIAGKLESWMYGKGFATFDGSPLFDLVTGERVNLAWLLAPLRHLTTREAQHEMDRAVAKGVVRRTRLEGDLEYQRAKLESVEPADHIAAALSELPPEGLSFDQANTIALRIVKMMERLIRQSKGSQPDRDDAMQALNAHTGPEFVSALRGELIKASRKAMNPKQPFNVPKATGAVLSNAIVRDSLATFRNARFQVWRKWSQRITGIGGGLTSDYKLAKKAFDEMVNDPHREAHDEFLRRYAVISNFVLGYLHDSGFLSAKQVEDMNNKYMRKELMAVEITNKGQVVRYTLDPKAVQKGDTWKTADGKTFIAKEESVPAYIDMHRLFDDDIITANLPTKGFKSSTRKVANPVQGLLVQVANAVAVGDRNRAMIALTDAFKPGKNQKRGEFHDLAFQVSKEEYEDHWRENDGERKNTYEGRQIHHFRRDGKHEMWVFNGAMNASLNAMHNRGAAGSDDLFSRTMRALVNLQRFMITRSPTFLVAQPFRDAQARMIDGNSGLGLDFVKNKAEELAKGRGELGRLTLNEAYHSTGGAFAGMMERLPDQIGQRMAEYLQSETGTGRTLITPWRKMLRAWEKIGEESDAINRKVEYLAAYKKARREGKSEGEARLIGADAGRGLIDFAEMGAAVYGLGSVLLFVNPALQGLRRLAQTRQERGNAAFALRIMTRLAPMQVMGYLAALLMMDEEDRERWLKYPAYFRDFNHIIPVGNGKNIMIPMPYEYGFMFSGARRMAEMIAAQSVGREDLAKDAWKNYGNSAFAAVLPLDWNSMSSGFAPVVESMMNYDLFRGRTIVPYWETYERDVTKRKGFEGASELGKIGSMLSGYSIDPRKVDHVIRGYGAGWGTMITPDDKTTLRKFLGNMTGLGRLYREPSPWSDADVEWVMDEARRRGAYSKGEAKAIRNLLKQAREKQDDEAKERAIRLARRVREKWSR